jgi:hypothetical protein
VLLVHRTVAFVAIEYPVLHIAHRSGAHTLQVKLFFLAIVSIASVGLSTCSAAEVRNRCGLYLFSPERSMRARRVDGRMPRACPNLMNTSRVTTARFPVSNCHRYTLDIPARFASSSRDILADSRAFWMI